MSMLGLTAARPTPVQVQLENAHWTIKSASSHSEVTEDQIRVSPSPPNFELCVLIALPSTTVCMQRAS
jgi:hypothetical protein